MPRHHKAWDGVVVTEDEQTSVVDWVDAITAQARSAARVFSASVPISSPTAAPEGHEELLSQVVESVERQGWRLDNVSTYGSAGGPYDPPAYWALLIFRTAYEGRL